MLIVGALIPLTVVFVLIFGWKKSALVSGMAGWLTAILLGFGVPGFSLGWQDLQDSLIRGSLITWIASYVMLFGIFLYHLMSEAGAIRQLADWIKKSTDDPVFHTLFLIVGVAPFLESASGFGVSALVTAPILLALGFSPVKTVLLSFLGMCAVPWGALATGTVIGAEIAKIPLDVIGVGSASVSVLTFLYFAGIAYWIAGGKKAMISRWPEWLTVSFALAVSIWAINKWIGVELAGALGGLVSAAVAWLWVQSRRRGERSVSLREIGKPVAPYLFLILWLLVTRWWPLAEETLNCYGVMELPAYSFRLPLLFSPGFALLVTCVATIFWFRLDRQSCRRACLRTWKQWLPVTLATVAFVTMSEVMFVSGMTPLLASAAASLFGSVYLAITPLIGGIGGFLTGSNTGANGMLMQLQLQTAERLGLVKEWVAIGQNVGSSHMNVAFPSRIVMIASICGIREKEAFLLKKLLMIAVGGTLLVIPGLYLLRFWG
ncbi:L-lactate permease [Kroppenstedtia pulmonis]|uniref:L-lactate permease n=1 Tax=Kroppenstedtia pulmonis TaxID=1380685 RepID=A0A7D3XZJ6_9BACL|nr:L-lactate permease [Kroppenstedtia pulmonis]QKG83660.1 L-lactate permease [Kroppenstedtia pulmonis]